MLVIFEVLLNHRAEMGDEPHIQTVQPHDRLIRAIEMVVPGPVGRQDQVAGVERHDVGRVLDELRHVPDHVPGIAVLAALPVHPELELEAVGVGKKALDLGIEHAQNREQFGRKIGVYQAVSHQLADTYVETELARSLAYWAAWCVAEDDEQAPVAVAAAKSYCGDAAVAACERSIQVHGGMGFTWEHVLHRYYKRALWIQAFGGHARKHRAQVAAWLLD